MIIRLKIFSLCICWLFCNKAFAQQPYSTGDTVKDCSISLMLNKTEKTSQLSQLQSDITIIDFFGTWCKPCIKALPHLTSLKQQFGNKLSIVLISNEEQQSLINFLNNNTTINFPIIVDVGEAITQLFKPPAYPYSIVINKNRKILSISNASALTAKAIEGWLQSATVNMDTIKAQPTMTENLSSKTGNISTIKTTSNPLIKLSQQFMYAAKTGGNTTTLVLQLENLDYDRLVQQLPNDDAKKAFWINIYNGFTQYFLKQNNAVYKKRSHFFGAKQIHIANKKFSLDDIEHGILRRSKIKWSEGYLNKLFPSSTEKKLRVSQLDYRLHFALNCGAESCPPIAFYDDENIDAQLNIATKAYLTNEAVFEATNNTLKLPTLMSWFRHDFGGKKKMLTLVQQIGIVPASLKPSISFKKYSWKLYLDNYKN